MQCLDILVEENDNEIHRQFLLLFLSKLMCAVLVCSNPEKHDYVQSVNEMFTICVNIKDVMCVLAKLSQDFDKFANPSRSVSLKSSSSGL